MGGGLGGGITSENLGSGSNHCQTRLNMGFTCLDTETHKKRTTAVITEMESVGKGVTAKFGHKIVILVRVIPLFIAPYHSSLVGR